MFFFKNCKRCTVPNHVRCKSCKNCGNPMGKGGSRKHIPNCEFTGKATEGTSRESKAVGVAQHLDKVFKSLEEMSSSLIKKNEAALSSPEKSRSPRSKTKKKITVQEGTRKVSARQRPHKFKPYTTLSSPSSSASSSSSSSTASSTSTQPRPILPAIPEARRYNETLTVLAQLARMNNTLQHKVSLINSPSSITNTPTTTTAITTTATNSSSSAATATAGVVPPPSTVNHSLDLTDTNETPIQVITQTQPTEHLERVIEKWDTVEKIAAEKDDKVEMEDSEPAEQKVMIVEMRGLEEQEDGSKKGVDSVQDSGPSLTQASSVAANTDDEPLWVKKLDELRLPPLLQSSYLSGYSASSCVGESSKMAAATSETSSRRVTVSSDAPSISLEATSEGRESTVIDRGNENVAQSDNVAAPQTENTTTKSSAVRKGPRVKVVRRSQKPKRLSDNPKEKKNTKITDSDQRKGRSRPKGSGCVQQGKEEEIEQLLEDRGEFFSLVLVGINSKLKNNFWHKLK